MMYIMDFFGKVLCCVDGRLSLRGIGSIKEDDIVFLGSDHNFYFRESACHFHEIDGNLCLFEGMTSDVLLRVTGNWLSVSSLGMALSSSQNGSLSFTFTEGETARFLCLSRQTCELVRYVSKKGLNYVYGAQGRRLAYVHNFSINDGEYSFPLEMNKTVSLADRDIVLIDQNLVVRQIRIFRPVLYMCAFSDESLLESAFLTIQSFREYAGISFSFVVFTNFMHVDIPKYLEDCEIKIVRIASHGIISHYFKRYDDRIMKYVADYSPIFYADLDILCNNDISDLFYDVYNGDKIFCSCEKDHSKDYVMESGWFISRFPEYDHDMKKSSILPVNSGFFGFPSVHMFYSVFHTITRLSHYIVEKYPDPPFCYDQGVFNYVITRMKCVDTQCMDRYILHWPPRHFADIEQCGIVHFCGGAPDGGNFSSRLENMTAYFQYLQEERKKVDLPALP